MKLNKLLLLAPIAVISLTSCGKQVRYNEDKYIINYNEAANAVEYESKPGNPEPVSKKTFNILQLSDIHFTYLADNEYHFKFIEKTIEAAKKALAGPDPSNPQDLLHLIVITGDTFTFATKDTIKDCCNFFEKQKIPWTITFGNHDEQGYFSVDWMTNYLTRLSKDPSSNLLFVDHPDDDIFGNANFVIDLHDNNEHKDDTRQIIMMDSNRYNYGEGMGYDYIHTDQIDWYERMFNHIKNDSDRSGIPSSLAFFHIPLPEFTDAYSEAIKDKNKFQSSYVYDSEGKRSETPVVRDVRGEDESSPLVNSHFLDRIAKCQVKDEQTGEKFYYTKGIFVGHDHINNYCVNYDYNKDGTNDITFSYGIKATNTVYYDDAYLGGQIIRFPLTAPTVMTDLVLHKYSQMEVK